MSDLAPNARGKYLARTILMTGLVFLLIILQKQLWALHNSHGIESEILATEQKNQMLMQENARLKSRIYGLKNGTTAIETHARSDLGYIKRGEIFVQVSSFGALPPMVLETGGPPPEDMP